MIVPTDDMSHAHVHVVDHHAEVVGRTAVGARNDQIVEFGVLKHHAAVDLVSTTTSPLDGILEADRRRHARSRLAALAAATVVARLFLARELLLAHALQFLLAAVAAVGLAALQHLRDDRPIALVPLSLKIRTLIGVEPSQRMPSRITPHGLLGGALAVGVFDAQDEPAAVMSRVQPGKQCRADAADVQQASGAGGKAGNDSHCVISRQKYAGPVAGDATGPRLAGQAAAHSTGVAIDSPRAAA